MMQAVVEAEAVINQNWRLYSFTNFYLNSVSKGLQTAHCAVDLVRHPKFANNPAIRQWADIDKTIIILNGGEQTSLNAIYNTLGECYPDTNFPYMKFIEDEGLNFATTCVCVLLPERIWSITNEEIIDTEQFNAWNETIKLIKGRGLAT